MPHLATNRTLPELLKMRQTHIAALRSVLSNLNAHNALCRAVIYATNYAATPGGFTAPELHQCAADADRIDALILHCNHELSTLGNVLTQPINQKTND